MSVSSKSHKPPFPTRYPVRPALALPRRPRSAEPTQQWSQPSSAPTPALGADVGRLFRQMEMALAERERALAEAEAHMAERTRDLDEMEALLRAREALIASTRLRRSNKQGLSPREAEALRQLKAELDRQEAGLKEARQALREREQFMEQSEARLFAKVQEQQEKETELEQREEELHEREAGRNTSATASKRNYDEFRE